jgi:peptidoglycan LD-endopeptidase CwlK
MDYPRSKVNDFVFSKRSLRNLEGVHPDLVKVVERALQLTEVDFVVVEGVRTPEKQKQYFDSGASKTMNSRHLTGHAVDLIAWVDRTVNWNLIHYERIAAAMKEAGRELGIPVEWGGDWKTFKDGPHFQLPWKEYQK